MEPRAFQLDADADSAGCKPSPALDPILVDQPGTVQRGAGLVLEFLASNGSGKRSRRIGRLIDARNVRRGLEPAAAVYLVAHRADTAAPAPGDEVLAALNARSQRLMAPLPKSAPAWIRTLAQASDQFIVRRGASAASEPAAYSFSRATPGSLIGAATP